MRMITAHALTFMTATVLANFAGTPASAQDAIPYYPWCAISDYGRDHSGRNCGFVSYEQCRQTILGQSGLCFENTWQKPGAVAGVNKRR